MKKKPTTIQPHFGIPFPKWLFFSQQNSHFHHCWHFQDVIGMQKSKEPPSPSIPQSYRVFHNLPQCHFQDVTPLPAFVCPIKTVPKNSLDLWTNLVSVYVRQVELVQFYTIFQVDVSLKGIVVLLENRKLALNKSNQSSCQYDTCLGHCSKRYLDSGYI